jgi:hypothetical protein
MLYFKTLQELREYATEIETTYQFLLRERSTLEKQVKIVRSRTKNMSKLLKEGKILDVRIDFIVFTLQENELRFLFLSCLQKIDELITCNGKKYEKRQGVVFQNTLLVLNQFCIGGQRREFVVAFDLKVITSFVHYYIFSEYQQSTNQGCLCILSTCRKSFAC